MGSIDPADQNSKEDDEDNPAVLAAESADTDSSSNMLRDIPVHSIQNAGLTELHALIAPTGSFSRPVKLIDLNTPNDTSNDTGAAIDLSDTVAIAIRHACPARLTRGCRIWFELTVPLDSRSQATQFCTQSCTLENGGHSLSVCFGEPLSHNDAFWELMKTFQIPRAVRFPLVIALLEKIDGTSARVSMFDVLRAIDLDSLKEAVNPCLWTGELVALLRIMQQRVLEYLPWEEKSRPLILTEREGKVVARIGWAGATLIPHSSKSSNMRLQRSRSWSDPSLNARQGQDDDGIDFEDSSLGASSCSTPSHHHVEQIDSKKSAHKVSWWEISEQPSDRLGIQPALHPATSTCSSLADLGEAHQSLSLFHSGAGGLPRMSSMFGLADMVPSDTNPSTDKEGFEVEERRSHPPLWRCDRWLQRVRSQVPDDLVDSEADELLVPEVRLPSKFGCNFNLTIAYRRGQWLVSETTPAESSDFGAEESFAMKAHSPSRKGRRQDEGMMSWMQGPTGCWTDGGKTDPVLRVWLQPPRNLTDAHEVTRFLVLYNSLYKAGQHLRSPEVIPAKAKSSQSVEQPTLASDFYSSTDSISTKISTRETLETVSSDASLAKRCDVQHESTMTANTDGCDDTLDCAKAANIPEMLGDALHADIVEQVPGVSEEDQNWLYSILADAPELAYGDRFRLGRCEFEMKRFNEGSAAQQGCRQKMEDESVIYQDVGLSDLLPVSYYAVYDGHGGRECAEFLRSELHLAFRHHANVISAAYKPDHADQRCILDSVESVERVIFEALYRAFILTDRAFLNFAGKCGAGSAAVVVVVVGTQIWCANTGDARCIVARKNGSAHQLSVDHKPYRADEKDRIQKAGGHIRNGRVLGRLAVSRAFGDVDYKSQSKTLVIADPEIRYVHKIEPDDEFMILACDGLFDVFGSQELVDRIRVMRQTQSVSEHNTYISNTFFCCRVRRA